MSGASAAASTEKQALIALRNLKRKVEDLEQARVEPIAIIGIGCRYPGGVIDPASFWRVLMEKVDAVREIPENRFPVAAFFDPDPNKRGTTYSRWAGLLDSVDQFDAAFFGVSPREASRCDPQQRLFLECAWEALEDAGIDPRSLAGRDIGVFAGATLAEYAMLRNKVMPVAEYDAYDSASAAIAGISGRLSYFLGLQGPSMTIDTACSASLTAVDRACRSLRDRESSLAIAGGVNILAVTESLITASRWGMLSPDGRCKAFDASANGFVRGEGCGILVLERLSSARANRRRILALIRGSAVNQDGASSGLTVPNGLAQQQVVRQALANSGVRPGEVAYVETHGTGTALGDPIEAEALGEVFRDGRDALSPMLIGSVKTNLGHCESASGVAGLIKVVLGLQHRVVPPQLHWRAPSPHIPWNTLPLKVVSEAIPWESINGRRIAGVSSFGFTGTNAHIVIEEAPAPEAEPALSPADRPTHILTLTAKSEEALREMAVRYTEHLSRNPEQNWAGTCYTSASGRAHFNHRLSARAGSTGEGVAALQSFLDGKPAAEVVEGVRGAAGPRIAFLFTGQGSQSAGMGSSLYQTSAVFRLAVDQCDAIIAGHLPVRAAALIQGEHPEAAKLIGQTLYTQPVLFTFEYALSQLWRSWGVEPSVVLGHSLGEYVAAVTAGVMALEDALKLVLERARLMHSVTADGAMLAAEVTEDEATSAISGLENHVAIAAINGPRQVVISGLRTAIEVVNSRLDAQGARTKWLQVSQAFHSPLLDGILPDFERRTAQTAFARPRIQMLSNLTGGVLDSVNARYWTDHMRRPVRFHGQIQTLRELGCDVLLEIGPRPVLIGLVQLSSPGAKEKSIASLRAGLSDWDSIARAVQELDAAGVDIDWTAWDREYTRRPQPLPFYPFERQRYWLSPDAQPAVSLHAAARSSQAAGPPLLGVKLASALPQTQFETNLTAGGEIAWISDHRIDGRVILPATGLLEMMLAAGSSALGPDWCELQDAVFLSTLDLREGSDPCLTQTIVDPPENGRARVRVFSRPGGDSESWELRSEATVSKPASISTRDPIATPAGKAVNVDEFYAKLRAAGVDFGPGFRRITSLSAGRHSSRGELAPIQSSGYRMHPAILDACLQVAAAGIMAGGTIGDELFLPLSVGRYQPFPSKPEHFDQPLTAEAAIDDSLEAAIRLYGSGGELLAVLEKVRFGRVKRQQDFSNWLHSVNFVPRAETRSILRPIGGTRWLVLADRGGVADLVAVKLKSAGAICTVEPAEADTASQLDRLVKESGSRFDGIVHLWSLDQPDFDALRSAADLESAQAAGYGTALHLAQTCLMGSSRPANGVWFVTRDRSAASSAVRSLRRTLAAERPEFPCFAFSLESAIGLDVQVDALIAEMRSGEEPEIEVRGGMVTVARIERMPPVTVHEEAGSKIQLIPSESGRLDELTHQRRPRPAPEDDEVEIQVYAAGLNFRDVLNALAMMPGSPPVLGGECAGIIARAGVDSGFRPGDEVMAFAGGAFGSYATALARNTVLKPAELSFEEASGMPVAYLTALYGLETLARLRDGESVLIHAGAGGLGMAAIRTAQAAGAVVHATAGSPAKQALLRSLGVQHIYGSRTLDFARQVLDATGGRGVDVVLNSLAGEFIDKSLSVTARGGRFLEVGKRGILTDEQAASLRPDVHYFPFDLGTESWKDPTLIPKLMKRLVSGVKSGWAAPLPITRFAFSSALEAFRLMAQGKHTGKIVLTQPALPAVQKGRSGTYLITGGSGSIGLAAAGWLVERGARSIVLCSRRPPDQEQTKTIAALSSAGAVVRSVQADCSDRDQMAALVASIPPEAPLQGILHAAGLVEDALLQDQNLASLSKTNGPKAIGAWHLHELTRNQPLDFFVMFSSAAAVLGSPGQANYAASNSLLDAIAHYRSEQGLPALSINWGPWAGGGMAAREAAGRRLGAFDLITPAAGFGIMESLLASNVRQAAVIPLRRWSDLPVRSLDSDPFFALVRDGVGKNAADPAQADFLAALTADSGPGRRKLLLKHLSEQAARVLGLPVSRRIDEGTALHDLGLDSLMAVELRNAVNASIGCSLPATAVLDHPTLGTLADYLSATLFGTEEKIDATPSTANVSSEIAGLDEEEAEALLAAELGMTTDAAKH